MLRGGGLMLPKPRAPHTKELMAASNLSGLTACSHTMFDCLTVAGKHSNHAMSFLTENKKPQRVPECASVQERVKAGRVSWSLYIVRYQMSCESNVKYVYV